MAVLSVGENLRCSSGIYDGYDLIPGLILEDGSQIESGCGVRNKI